MNEVKIQYEDYFEVAAFSTRLLGDPGVMCPRYHPWLLTLIQAPFKWIFGLPRDRGGKIVMNGKWACDHDWTLEKRARPVTFWYNDPRDAVYVKLTWGNSSRRISSL